MKRFVAPLSFPTVRDRLSRRPVRSGWLPLLAGLLLASPLRAQTALVNHADSWRYRKGTTAPQANWKTVTEAGLDSTWLTGNGGFGYADNATETALCATLLTDMKGLYSTVAMRRSFQVASSPDATAHLVLTMDWDD